MMRTAEILLLSAGLGTRLRPLTDTVPKPLIKVQGKTLIERNLELIAREGFTDVFINLHYLGEQISNFVGDGSRWGLNVRYSREEILLDTGGAIRKIEPLLKGQTLITINSDILVGRDFPLRSLLDVHEKNRDRPLATMVLRPDENVMQYGAIGVNDAGRVVTFLGEDFGLGQAKREFMFLGIQLLDRAVFTYMPEGGEVFSITRHTLRKILQCKGIISSVVYSGFWSDIGTAERLEAASKVDGAF